MVILTGRAMAKARASDVAFYAAHLYLTYAMAKSTNSAVDGSPQTSSRVDGLFGLETSVFTKTIAVRTLGGAVVALDRIDY